MGTSCTWTLTLLTLSVSLIFVETTYSGGCYSNYGLNVTTCSEVYQACSSMSSCSYNDGKLSFYCYNVGCYGTWQNDSVTIDVCESVYFSTCEEADTALYGVGCECSKCYDNGNTIYASCYYPFNCSVQSYANHDADDLDYLAPLYVYCGVTVALVLNAILASLCCTSTQNRELTTKEIVRMKLSCFSRCIYRMTLGSFVLEDGSRMQFIDYVCDKRDMLGVIHCCKTTANLRPRWMRFCAFVATHLVTIAVAFVFGTVVYNTEDCTYSQDTCDGLPMAVACIDGSNGVFISSYCGTALLSLAVSKGSALAVNSLQTGSLRQKLQLTATLLIATGLVIYSVLFSNVRSKGVVGDDYNGDSRRLATIGHVVLIGYGIVEALGVCLAICRFLTCWVCYAVVYQSRLEKEKKSARTAAIYPQEGRKLDPVSIETGRTNSANGPNTMVEEDEQKLTISSITTPNSTDPAKPTIEVEDGQSIPVDAAQVAVSVSKSSVKAVEWHRPTSPLADATPVPVGAPKPVTEGESQQKTANPHVEAPAAPAQANSPKAKTGEAKPTYRVDAGKQMSTRFDRTRTLTENIKLEPPMRGTQQ